MRPVWTLFLILLLAIFLRIYHLDMSPPSLFGDEVDVGYQAFSLLKTGQDVYGQSLPTLIHSFSEYRAPLFIYSEIPFVATFGLDEWGVRGAAVFWGILGVVGIYLLTRRLFNEKIALFSALILSISPWHIQYSRAAFEVTMLLAIILFASYFFLKGIENNWHFFLAFFLFGLTPYIYSTAVVFMPLLLLLLVFLSRAYFKKNLSTLILVCTVFLITIFPYSLQTISGKAGERFSVISVFSSEDLKDKAILAQQQEQLPLHFEKVFHGMPIIWAREITLNYLRAFSPEFLFLTGDPNLRHSVQEMGEMYIFEIALLLSGLWIILKKESRYKWFILGWLFIAPLPAALTFDGGFHATRNFLMLAPLAILVALGINYLRENSQGKHFKYFLVFLLILVASNISTYFHHYFAHYPKESWRAWNYGFKEAMQYIGENNGNYSQIFINNTYEPVLIRFLFWTGYDPASFHQNFTGDKMVGDVASGFNGFSLEGKYFFGKFSSPFEERLTKDTLFVASARDDITNTQSLGNSNVRLLKTIYSPTEEPIFYILTGNK